MTMMSDVKPALALATLTYAGPAAKWRTEAMRSHATPRLIHITKGQGRITVAGLTNGYGPNNLIFIPAETIYGLEVGPTVFGQIMTLPSITDWPDHPFHLRLRDVAPQKELQGYIEAIERELQPGGDDRAAACHLGLLTIFVERQLQARDPASIDQRRNSAAGKLVARYATLIARDFAADRSVADFATALNVTPTHLTRVCQQTCGRSALKLLNERIHYEACMLLRDTKEPVQDIARRLGFRSAAYFTRSFQEKSGQTPSDFRRTGGAGARI
ncbi:helix-turn-helix transcriptional regulator [Cognatiyoonia sp. IB215182]|uniref:helix-turn-helix domain-containing protein n=1 Tax=Cognatiyoonia sp. IB215182 TaxID=3097353 RepID=UPI002A0D4E51|nr:helix-turn-helix transcriptional regulator [Cognatiyoonia sp. IB215182]MDX8352039.1 helix-turn-helix transcriptional regulator [Cognatiyoonia sp. IB215182]